MSFLDPLYKSAEELGIPENERKALIDFSRELMTGKYEKPFYMGNWSHCIYGHIAERLGHMCGERRQIDTSKVHGLYAGYSRHRTPEEAGEAIQRFLLGLEY